jgi:Raf kinase inhibitor-like YbhB/YbcL family protein
MNFIILYIMATIAISTLTVKSFAFKNKGFIPSKYTSDGENINPDIIIEDIPADTKSLAIIMEDPYASNGIFCHWVMWDIPPKNIIRENSKPGVQGKNSRRENKYKGPCPPSGRHQYHFKVYALDTELGSLSINTDRKGLLDAMEGHVISSGNLVGLYERYKSVLW